MFRPSGGLLQFDICTILGSMQIAWGREISLITGFFTSLVFTYNLFQD